MNFTALASTIESKNGKLRSSKSRQSCTGFTGSSTSSAKNSYKEGEVANSILKSSMRAPNRDSIPRKDNYGTEITTGGRTHRILFPDAIVQVREVENWKHFNKEEPDQCICLIF